ncbi:MAG: ABC transporter ATP-binding protein [Geminicoccaceae bacterium]
MSATAPGSPSLRTAPSDRALVLELEGVSRSFGGIAAVRGVSLAVAHGEIVGIIGPNGSGKSTLFNLIAGELRPDAGRVLLEGRNVTGWKPHRVARAGIARTFQIPALFDNMTVWENLLAAAVEGNWASAPARAERTLELLQLEPVRDNLASDISGGQQKLLEFGRARMREPTVVLLDEVTAGVHVTIRETILNAVRAMRQGGATFLLIEHDMELVRAVCERIVVMDFGEIMASGDFETISRDSEVMGAYLGRRG